MAAQTNASAMPVLPLVGSTMTVSLLILPVAFGGLDHRHADAVLDAAQRIEKLALERDGRVQAGGDVVEPHERRVADGLDDVIVNLAAGRHGDVGLKAIRCGGPRLFGKRNVV